MAKMVRIEDDIYKYVEEQAKKERRSTTMMTNIMLAHCVSEGYETPNTPIDDNGVQYLGYEPTVDMGNGLKMSTIGLEKNKSLSDDKVHTASTPVGPNYFHELAKRNPPLTADDARGPGYNVSEGQSVPHSPTRRTRVQIQMEINAKKDAVRRIMEESQDPDDFVTAEEIEAEIRALWVEWQDAQ